jgi:hypothetical protein
MAFEIAFVPVAAIVAIVVVFVAWKFFKFAVKKITAILQGLIALALLGYVMSQQVIDLRIAFGLAAVAILLGAIANVLS